jgi:arylamine N-acetyltransferase
MDLAAYLRRIGYDGPTRPDLETLHGVVSAHATTVPYETFDVFLGRPMTTNPDVAYRKIVGEAVAAGATRIMACLALPWRRWASTSRG